MNLWSFSVKVKTTWSNCLIDNKYLFICKHFLSNGMVTSWQFWSPFALRYIIQAETAAWVFFIHGTTLVINYSLLDVAHCYCANCCSMIGWHNRKTITPFQGDIRQLLLKSRIPWASRFQRFLFLLLLIDYEFMKLFSPVILLL